MAKQSAMQNQSVERLVQLEYLGLTEEDLVGLKNPFERRTAADIAEPHMHVLRLMRDPNYFYYTAKVLCGIELMPFQCVFLKEMWCRRFPMLIASRGAGKCTHGDTWVIKQNGFSRIADIVGDIPEKVPRYENKLSLIGENGPNKVEYSWCNGLSKTKKIRTRLGFEIEVTPNHPIRVVRNNELCWVEASDIRTEDSIPMDRSNEWFDNPNDMEPDTAYLFGLLVGDGGYTVRGRIGMTTADLEIAESVSRIAMKLWGKSFTKQNNTDYQYNMWGVGIWDSLFSRHGFVGIACGDKEFPREVMGASKATMASFIRGLADTDGYASKKLEMVEFSSKSVRLMETLQIVLLKFGIVSKRWKKLNKKYNRYYHYISITGGEARKYGYEIGFGLKRKQEILESHRNRVLNPNKDLLPRELVEQDILDLADNWREVRTPAPHGYNRIRQLFAPSRIKAYEFAYSTLVEVLDTTKTLGSNPAHQRLSNIVSANYFYDRVDSIEDSEAVTYDVHMESEVDHSFISNGFISHNSFLLGLYSVLRALLKQGSKIVICGSGFRQAKTIFNFAESIWQKSPMLQSLVSGGDGKQGPEHGQDRWVLRLGDSTIVAIPIGTGEKIRGERANCIVADEFPSIPEQIFEEVISGFGVVNLSPVENVKKAARRRVLDRLRALDVENKEIRLKNQDEGNQIILSGTAYYDFNHFAKYWKRWCAFIRCNNDATYLRKHYGIETDATFNSDDYAVIRFPHEMIPENYYDMAQINRAKMTIHSGIFQNEYSAVFSKDSNGFYPRSLIETCCTSQDKPIQPVGADQAYWFNAVVRGNPACTYTIGIDPAAREDNFAIVVLENHKDHRRVVYCWTTTKEKYRARCDAKLIEESTYYGYCARKIRELMRVFNTEIISLDAQGGGQDGVLEALHDPEKMRPGESPIWPLTPDHALSDNKIRSEDNQPGLHIVELVNFSRAEWVSAANHGLRKDLEDAQLLFPQRDSITLGEAFAHDQAAKRLVDTLEECVDEIDELKEELSTITYSQTPGSLRDKWDTPEEKLPGMKKGRLRKDRYSALLMANYASRRIYRELEQPEYIPYGGFTDQLSVGGTETDTDLMFVSAPDWYTKGGGDSLEDFGFVLGV